MFHCAGRNGPRDECSSQEIDLPDLSVPRYQITRGIQVPNVLVDKSVASG